MSAGRRLGFSIPADTAGTVVEAAMRMKAKMEEFRSSVELSWRFR
jgi:hypothetical protein